MNKVYSKYLFAIVMLGIFSCAYACSDNKGKDEEENRGGNQTKMLPVKIVTDLGNNNIKSFAYEYDTDNRLVKIKEEAVMNQTAIQSHKSSIYSIVYGHPVNGEEAVKNIIIESTITSSVQTGEIKRKDRYELTYFGNNVEVRLVSSYDSSHPQGMGGALGVITIETNDKGQIIKRIENWDNGLKSNQTFSYHSDGNLAEIIGNSELGINVTTTRATFDEYDDKNSIFGAINAPKWFDQLPISLVGGKGVNNVLKYSSYFNSQEPSVTTTSYTYNTSGYPTQYVEKNTLANSPDEIVWTIEY